MLKQKLHLLIFMVTLLSLLSVNGLTVAEAAEGELLPAPISQGPAEELFDDLVAYVWELITPALSMPPPAVSSWNH